MKSFVIALGFFLFVSVKPGSAQESFEVTHGPYLQHVGEEGATFVWTTNRPGIAWVELAPDDGTHFYLKERPKYFGTNAGLKDISTLHKVRINDLKPGTRYRYRIFSQEVLSRDGNAIRYGEVVGTRVFKQTPPSFRTNTTSKKEVSFLMLNDIHERNDVMKQLLQNGNWENTDLILFNGDMVNSMRSKEQMFGSFMDTAVQMFAKEIPMYYARGNHEDRGEFAGSFSKYFPSPTGNIYYLFRQGPVCFIVLDCGEDKPDSDIEYSKGIAFDNYRTKEAQWLEEAIQEEAFVNAPFKIGIIHMPPFGGWHGEQDVDQKFIPLLNKAGIDVLLCGHLHRYVRREASEGDWDFPIIVNSNNSVLRGEVDQEKLDVQIIDREGKKIDSLLIEKNEKLGMTRQAQP